MVISEKLREEKENEFEKFISVKEENTLYVTDFVRCPLKNYYEKIHKELAKSGVFTPSIILGDFVHVGLEEFIKNNFANAQTEVDVEREIIVNGRQIKIQGRIDALAEIDGEKTVIEIKTTRSDKGLPYEHHKAQLQIYMWMTGIKKGLLVYVTPDSITEYPINEPLDEAVVIRLTEETLKMSKTPRYSWECKYCVFSSICPSKK